jgi:hypothetical protein
MNKVVSCFGLVAALVFSAFLASATAPLQKENDDQAWTKWTKKEAEKVLNDSPWSKVQTDTDTSEMFFSETGRSIRTANDASRAVGGATNQEVNVKFIVRFFSARPVRRALVRLMELEKNPTADGVQKLHSFADVKADNSIIITVTFSSNDQRYERSVMQSLNSAITATLKNDTYLERDGKRLFLEEYYPPGSDGFGARFIFLRELNQKPFIADNSGEVRFYSKFPNGGKIDRRFKVSEMMYNGALEY